MLRTPSFRSHIFHLLCFEIPSTKHSLPTCAYIYTYIHVYSYIIWKCIQYIRITYNADLSLKLIHRDSLIMSHHGRGRLDLKSLRLPKFQKNFTGVPVHIKHAFSGVPKFSNRLSRESPSLKRVSGKTGRIWRSKYPNIAV